MSVPASRNEFKEYCLRKLGKGPLEINISDEQVDDRIDEALNYYWDYHFDGSEKVYYKHQISQTDIDNKYITLPENIIGAVQVFPVGGPSIGSEDMFNIQYQIALNDLYTLTSVSMIPYYMVMEHLSLITQLLVGNQPIRYSRHKDRLYVDMSWNKVTPGKYLLVEAYEVIDPAVYTDAWGDRWLQNYATAKIQENWGRNLTKFVNYTLPGGVQFNGQAILEDAQQTIAKMEQEMMSSYSLPVHDMVG